MIVKVIANVDIKVDCWNSRGDRKNYTHGGKLEVTIEHCGSGEIMYFAKLLEGMGASHFWQKPIQYIECGDEDTEYFSNEEFENFINDNDWIEYCIGDTYCLHWSKARVKHFEIKILSKTMLKRKIAYGGNAP